MGCNLTSFMSWVGSTSWRGYWVEPDLIYVMARQYFLEKVSGVT